MSQLPQGRQMLGAEADAVEDGRGQRQTDGEGDDGGVRCGVRRARRREWSLSCVRPSVLAERSRYIIGC